jgi:hypothetical protein
VDDQISQVEGPETGPTIEEADIDGRIVSAMGTCSYREQEHRVRCA